MKDVELFEKERAKNYDSFINQWVPGYDFLLNSTPNLLKHLSQKEDSRLLVAGCGTGNEILALLNSDLKTNIFGVDPSPEMIEQAKSKLQQFENVQLQQGLVRNINRDERFDAATLFLVMHFLKDDGSKEKLLHEISTRLHPGGTLIIVDIFGEGESFDKDLQALKCLLPYGIEEEEMNVRIERIRSNIQYISEERLFELLRKTGFDTPVRYFHTSIYGAWVVRKKH